MCTGVAVQGLLVVRMCRSVDVGKDSGRWLQAEGLSKLLAGSLLHRCGGVSVTAAAMCAPAYYAVVGPIQQCPMPKTQRLVTGVVQCAACTQTVRHRPCQPRPLTSHSKQTSQVKSCSRDGDGGSRAIGAL